MVQNRNFTFPGSMKESSGGGGDSYSEKSLEELIIGAMLLQFPASADLLIIYFTRYRRESIEVSCCGGERHGRNVTTQSKKERKRRS